MKQLAGVIDIPQPARGELCFTPSEIKAELAAKAVDLHAAPTRTAIYKSTHKIRIRDV